MIKKKDLGLIAAVIKRRAEWARGKPAERTIQLVAKDLASMLEKNNPNFKPKKFLEACAPSFENKSEE